MNRAREDIYILGYNCLNTERASTDLDKVYRDEPKAVLSQTGLEADTVPDHVAKVLDGSGSLQTIGEHSHGSPHYSGVDNHESPHDSEVNNGDSSHGNEDITDAYKKHTE